MPPTIQTNVNPGEQRPQRPGDRRSELVCRVKYCNTLPDLPFDPKFITYPFESTRFIQYNPTSLERNYKYEVLTEHDLGVTIDLINRDTYATDYNNYHLDPADEKLLEEDILTQQDSKRSRHHAQSVSWLRRTEYISTEQTRFQPQTMDKVEAKVGFSIKKNFKDETLYMDRDSQIKAIEKTFKDSKSSIEKHYSKPNVVAVEVQDIFPDFKLWKYPCAQVIFDSDPAPVGRSVPAQIEEMSQAMIRGVMDESGEQFVAYFLPTESTLEKRRTDFTNNIEYSEEEEYEYKMAREYNWNVKSKASKGYEENYFLVMRPDGVYFNELETRVRLSKRRQKAGQQANNTRLVVRHRPLNAQEFKMQRYREKQLEPPNEEDEEEEEEEEQGGLDTVQQNKSDGENEEKDDEKGSRSRSGSERERSDKEESDREKSDKEESEREKSDKEESDKEKSDKEGSDHDGSDREDSTKADNEKEYDEKEAGSRSESEKGESDREGGGSGSDEDRKNDAASGSSGSRSSSRSRSKSQSRSRSRSASQSRSRSGSPAGSRSPSRSGSGSGSGSSSASNSGSDSDDDK